MGKQENDEDKADEIIKSVKRRKKKKWSKEQRAKFAATMKAKRNG